MFRKLIDASQIHRQCHDNNSKIVPKKWALRLDIYGAPHKISNVAYPLQLERTFHKSIISKNDFHISYVHMYYAKQSFSHSTNFQHFNLQELQLHTKHII